MSAVVEDHIKVLLFEDEAESIHSLSEMLHDERNISYEVEDVTIVNEDEQSVAAFDYDVILLDVTTPDSQEVDTVAKIVNRWEKTPIIVLAEDEASAINAILSGAHDYLIKNEVESTLLRRTIRYVVERERLLEQLRESKKVERHLAYHDPLTNLPNRVLFRDRLEQAIALAKRQKQQVALLFLDLDGFKRINDTLGHSVGDLLLQSAAGRLKKYVREVDTIARLGGDEFTIVLFGINHADDAAKVARKILRLMSQPFGIDDHELFITVSIGISIFPFDGTDIEALIKKADIAMYRAKGQGKNRFEIYNLAMDAKFYEYLTLESSLWKAAENDQLVIHYQPQVNLKTGEVVGVEALVRWEHPDFGLVPPDKFIPIAEETGVIVSIDSWVMRNACKQIKALQDSGFPHLGVAINLSARQFRLQSLPQTIEDILCETGISQESICLEITESYIMQNVESTIEILSKLKEMGVRLSLDDFGKGYSSLNYLKKFPIDILKIDRAFVRGIPEDRNDTAISTAIVVLAKSMGLKVIAEGIENKEQLEYLDSLHCDEIQGYYFSRPLPEDLLIKLLESGKKLPRSEIIE